MVTGMRDGKCFITLPDSAEWAIVVQKWSFNEATQETIIWGKKYSLGDYIQVQLSHIDTVKYKLYFDII
jgi:hypothetical protein